MPLFLPVFAGAVVDNPRPKVLFSSRVCLWGLKGLLMLDCNNWPVNKQKKNTFIKFWPKKSLLEGVDAESVWFGNWQVFALLFSTCDYFTQLRPLLHFFNQSAVEIQYETSRACMLFPRLPLVDSSFASRTLQFFCGKTRSVDFNKARLGTTHVSRLCVHTSSCKRRKRRHLLLSFRERHKSV